MESEDIWKAYQLGLRVCQIICGSPYGIRLSSLIVYYKQPKRFHRYRIYLGSIFLHLYVAICVINMTGPIFGVVLLKNFNSLIVNVVLAVIFSVVCVPSKHLCLSPREICGVFNRLGPIKSAVAAVYKRNLSEAVNPLIIQFLAFSLRLVILLAIWVCTMGGIFLVYFHLDPLGHGTEILFSKLSINETIRTVLQIGIRYLAIIIAIMEAGCSAIIYIPGAIVMLITLNSSISRITELATNPIEVSWTGFTLNPVALQTIQIYKMIQLYLSITEPIYSTEIPMLISCGSLLAIVCNFATIKLYDKLELPVYICGPIFSVFVLIMVLTLVPQAHNVYEKCCDFRTVLKVTSKSKMQKAVAKSLKPFGMNATFFIVKASVRTKIVEYQMYYTMTLLISVGSWIH